MMNKTKGQLEADISALITKFEKEHLGRGPKEVRTFIIQDLILIRLKGILTPAEEKLITEVDGAQIVKQVRRRLIESSRSILDKLIEEKIEAKVVSLQSDISSRTGERIIIFGMDRNVEEGLKK